MTLRQFWDSVNYRGAPVVRNRAELEAALAHPPRHIIVEGTEALRAYAATFAYRGGVEAAEMEAAAAGREVPPYMMVPTVGRITDGYRPRRTTRRGGRAMRLKPGLTSVLVATGGVVAALFVEWLSFPANDPQIVRSHSHAAAPRLLLKGAQLKLPTRAPDPPPLSWHELAFQAGFALLLVLAAAALVYVAFVAAGFGRPKRVSWRVAYRVQGRLIIARVRTTIS